MMHKRIATVAFAWFIVIRQVAYPSPVVAVWPTPFPDMNSCVAGMADEPQASWARDMISQARGTVGLFADCEFR